MRRRKKKKSGVTKGNIEKQILKLFTTHRQSIFNYKQIASKLKITDANGRQKIIKELHSLQIKNTLEEVQRGKYKLKTNTTFYRGILDLSSKGSGYVICKDFTKDVHISKSDLNRALHKDEVEFYIYNKHLHKGKPSGVIVNIIQRATTNFVGVIYLSKDFAFVTSDSSKMYTDIFVPLSQINNAKEGDKVLVTIEEWQESQKSPTGKVVKVLGQPGEHQTEIHSILAEYGLPYQFPEEVEAYANAIDTTITKEETEKRRDMRDILTFTIDPKDAKDFDDALSFQKLPNNNYEVGIHIADVSHYLKEGTILDEEAYERATSVYLVDRVVPMLPEVLSNKACSLRPHEEKYTFSAVFELNNKGIVQKEWFGRTVTYSDARFAYEEAQVIIDQNNASQLDTINCNIPKDISITGKAYTTTKPLANAILKLNTMAKEMRQRRMANGALSFDKVEVKFNLDSDNNPKGVYFKSQQDANKLIEEFMLLANKKVAEFVDKKSSKKTFVYRVHDSPDDSKLSALKSIANRFGHTLQLKDRVTITQSLNKLLKNVKGKKEQHLIDTLAIRTMSKAEYTTQNIGHYGLAFKLYTHFTSPIRRYPDVITHRLLQKYLNNEKSENEEAIEIKCKHSSHREYLATKAERDSVKYMQIKYMQDHINKEFRGIISGVTDWGIYVELLSNKCEGMVRIKDITDDYYRYDEKQFALIGNAKKNMLQLGEEVIVKVKKTDLIKKHLDFILIGKVID